MNDKYVVNLIEKIKNALDNKDYFLAGQELHDMIKYGVIIGDRVLIFLTSELSDVFRNCFLGVKEFQKLLDESIIKKILSNVKELLDLITHKEANLDNDDKIKIFDSLTYIISEAERIQLKTRDLEGSRAIRRRLYRGGPL